MGNDCTCILNEETEVPYEGPKQADIMFVGESPGREEVRHGKPFYHKAPSGKMLSEACHKIGIDRYSLFVANSAKCLIDKSALSTKQIKTVLDACRPKLVEAIKEVKPKLIVCLGDIAMAQVLKKKGIKKARGTFFWSSEFNAQVLPTWHPGFVLRNPSAAKDFNSDFSKIRIFIDNKNTPPQMSGSYSWKEVDTIRPLLEGGLYKEEDSFVTAIDTETQGTLWYDPNSLTLSYSVAASLTEGWQVYLYEEVDSGPFDLEIPVTRGKEETVAKVRKAKNFTEKIQELKELCQRDDIKKYFMNQKYDLHRLYSLGITKVNNAPMDIALAAHAIDAQRFTYPSLKTLFEVFTGEPSHKDEFSEHEKEDMLLSSKTKREAVTKYAALDAVATLKTALELKKILLKDKKTATYYINFCHPIETKFLFILERAGIQIDISSLVPVRREIEQKMEEEITKFKKACPQEVLKVHGTDFSLTKRAALCDALFVYAKDGEEHNIGFGIEPVVFSQKSGMPSTDKKVLADLLNKKIPKKAGELITCFSKWSQYHVLLSRYISNIRKFCEHDARIHPSYTLTATVSGRTGAASPSIQNFPKRSEPSYLIRKLLVAREGRSLIEADHSMAELRFIADVANDPNMKKIFLEGGDIHLATGLALVGKTVEEAADSKELKKIRQNAKAVNFGLSYLMSATGLRAYAKHNYGVELSQKQAISWRSLFLHRLYPAIPSWHQKTEEFVLVNKYIRHKFGRIFYLPNVDSSDTDKYWEAIRMAVNLQIQGPSSDFTLLGGYEVVKDPDFSFSEARAVAFIHDALMFEVDDDKIEKYGRIIKKRMEGVDVSKFGATLSVPFKVDLKVGKNLSEMKDLIITEDGHEDKTKQE